jgi:hypothetical protein
MDVHSKGKILLLVALCTLIGPAGCSQLGPDNEASGLRLEPLDFSRFSQAPSLLVGRWEWRQSTVYGPGEPGVRTPATTGRTETLVFPSPDTVRVYRNDTLSQRSARDAFFEDAKWGVHEDTLATSTAFRDGPEVIYERVE